jgi:hypothetical protein
MDIVFQSGEFINQENPLWSFLQLASSFLGIVASGWIALRVYRNGVRRELEKEQDRLTELEGYIKQNLLLLAIPVNKAVEEIKKYAKELAKKEVEKVGSPVKVASLHAKHLRNISHSDLYKIFITNKAGDIAKKTVLFHDLISHIEYVDSVQSFLEADFSELQVRRKEYEKSWFANIIEINRIVDEIGIPFFEERKRNPDHYEELFCEMDNICFLWKQEGTDSRYFCYTKLLLPLFEYCRHRPHEPRAIKLLQPVSEAKRAFENTYHLHQFYRRSFLRNAIGLRRSAKKLLEITEEVGKCETEVRD